jgi:HAE1 family hydrophobic/amphiphilic exporter-1
MTSFAFILGLMPLVVAHGAGAIGNRSIGTAAAGGMLVGTSFGLLLVPGLYVIFAGMMKVEKPAEPATEEVQEEVEEPMHA